MVEGFGSARSLLLLLDARILPNSAPFAFLLDLIMRLLAFESDRFYFCWFSMRLLLYPLTTILYLTTFVSLLLVDSISLLILQSLLENMNVILGFEQKTSAFSPACSSWNFCQSSIIWGILVIAYLGARILWLTFAMPFLTTVATTAGNR